MTLVKINSFRGLLYPYIFYILFILKGYSRLYIDEKLIYGNWKIKINI